MTGAPGARHRGSRWLAAARVGALVAATASVAGVARAESDSDMAARLGSYEAEVRQLGADLPRPNQLAGAGGPRRLLDAELAYSLGDYDAAALMLFDLAARPGPDHEAACFYLAESLFQKGDKGAAAGYYEQVVSGGSVASRYYQPSLERLIEIAIVRKDETHLADHLAALDRVTPALRLPSVPYVRGKLAYAQGKFDEAAGLFQDVPKGSDYELQAAYYLATSYVAKLDLARASQIFTDLVGRVPRTSNDRRMIELSQLALGRLYYERDQAAQSIDAKEQDDPATEYDRAVQIFTETHDMYAPSYAALAQMIGAGTPPERYLGQIAGRSEHVFQAAAPLPEAAVQYLRDEPAVQRVVAVEGDLDQIRGDLAGTAATVARLEGVLAAGDRGAVYPGLSGRRTRLAAIESSLIKLRGELAEQELRLVAGSGELAALTANRREQVTAFAAMPDPERTAETHALQNRGRYDALEQSATEVESAIGATQAIAVALRKYTTDARDLPAEAGLTRRGVTAALDDAAREAEAIENELDQVHRELQIGRDLAGVGDPSVGAAAQARAQVRSAQDAEHKLLAGLAATSRDRDQSRRLALIGDRAARLADQLTAAEHEIDGAIDQGLQEVRGTLAEARATLAAYQAELAEHEAETRSIGGSVLGASLQAVEAKFYDIVVRSDVGNVDVSWSQKEDVDDDLKRLNLSRQRELKQLKDEFKDILDAGTPRPSAPAHKPEPATAEPAPLTGSPDKAEGDQRIVPGTRPGDRPGAPASPAVKPDAKKPAARSRAPAGGSATKPAGTGGAR